MSRIIIVDDEKTILLNLIAYLEDEGFDVIGAESAEQALELIVKENPDVGIIDLRLPEMNGNELILAAHKLRPSMKVLIHTGSTDYILPNELEAIGICEEQVIHKPVSDMKIICDAIKKLLGH